MSQNNGFHNRSEKGLLTPDNCVVALIDHQPQMLFGTSRSLTTLWRWAKQRGFLTFQSY